MTERCIIAPFLLFVIASLLLIVIASPFLLSLRAEGVAIPAGCGIASSLLLLAMTK